MHQLIKLSTQNEATYSNRTHTHKTPAHAHTLPWCGGYFQLIKLSHQ